MPPNAFVSDGMVGGMDLGDYGRAVEGGEALVLVKGSQFTVTDFRPVKALGSGDMGNVFLVAQKDNQAPLALKVMKKDVLKERQTERRAQAERDILASVNHPLLPVLHSHFEDEKRMYLVMNYCHGGDLNALRHQQPEKRFSENACRFYIAEALVALEYLHKRNIAYRDLKPENILIQPNGHIMLTDFDLSLDLSERKWTKPTSPSKDSTAMRQRLGMKSETKKSKWFQMKSVIACGSPGSLTKMPSKKSRITPEESHHSKRRGADKKDALNGPTNSFVGTEEYVAPEIIWGMGHGLPVDWWSLGVLLHELFYGKTPFKGDNRKATFFSILCKPVTFPGIPTPLMDLIEKLLVKEPEDRLGTKGGAEQIKKHRFFDGVNWDELEHITRPPVVPEAFSWEQIEERLAAKAKAAGKEVQTKWSFFEPAEPQQVEEREHKNSATESSECGTLTSDISARDDLQPDSSAGTSPPTTEDAVDLAAQGDRSTNEDICSKDSSLDVQSDSEKQYLPSVTPKEEVRLADEDLMERKLFEDFF